MKLEDFKAARARLVLSWVSTFQENQLWCELKSFPLNPEVFMSWHLDSDVHPYIATLNDEPVAYGELLTHEDRGEAEILRLLVAPGYRRQGIGQQMIQNLHALCPATIETIYARLLPHNSAAYDCFMQAEFQRVTAAQEAQLNEWEAFPSVWMERKILKC